HAGGKRNVDRVDIATVEQLLVTAARDRGGRLRHINLALVDELQGAGTIAAGDGDERRVAGVADRFPVLAGDVRGAEDSPAATWLGHEVVLTVGPSVVGQVSDLSVSKADRSETCPTTDRPDHSSSRFGYFFFSAGRFAIAVRTTGGSGASTPLM